MEEPLFSVPFRKLRKFYSITGLYPIWRTCTLKRGIIFYNSVYDINHTNRVIIVTFLKFVHLIS